MQTFYIIDIINLLIVFIVLTLFINIISFTLLTL